MTKKLAQLMSFGKLSLALLAGGMSSLLFLVAFLPTENGLLFLIHMSLGYMAAVPLYLAGFGAGVGTGLTASLAGIVSLLIMRPSEMTILYTVMNVVPAMVLVVLIMHYHLDQSGKKVWSSEGTIVTVITLIPALTFLGVLYTENDNGGGLLSLTKETFKTALLPAKEKLDKASFDQLIDNIDPVARYFPSVVAICWITLIIISIGLAYALLKKRGLIERPAFQLRATYLPAWLVYVTALVGGIAVCTVDPFQYGGQNLFIILAVPFFVVGLAIIHGYASKMKNPKVVLSVFYVLLGMTLTPCVILTLCGAIDQWLNFRGRLKIASQPNH